MTRRTIDERLEKHSSLRARFEAILDIAEGESDGPDTANAVEERAIVEVRKLGQELMQEWAAGKVAKEVEAHKSNKPKARIHKKKEHTGIPHSGALRS